MQSEDFQILYEKLAAKVKQMRALQREQEKYKNWFGTASKAKLYRLQREVDNMLVLDEEGIKVFIKNNR